MFKVNRRYVQDSKNSPGYYEYFVVEYTLWLGMDVIGWMSESKYRAWKQEIIEENFPHCE